MRNMSFAFTTSQVKKGTKTVTRRMGWLNLKPGELVKPVEKAMGLKKGEKIKVIRGPIRILNTRREPLNKITKSDCTKEGFPDMQPKDFVQMLCKYDKCKPEQLVTRIEFEYTD